MNISKFTQKSIEAVNSLEKLAYEYGNQEIEQEHLLYALLKQEDSLILKMIERWRLIKRTLPMQLSLHLRDAPRFPADRFISVSI